LGGFLESIAQVVYDFFAGQAHLPDDIRNLYNALTGDVSDSKNWDVTFTQGGGVPGINVPVSSAVVYFHAWSGDSIKPSFGRTVPSPASTIIDRGESRYTRGNYQYEYRFEIPFATVAAAKYMLAFGTGDNGDIQDAAIAYTLGLTIGPPTQSVPTIDEKFTQLGGAQGFLGSPQTSEQQTPDGIGRYRHFDGGSLYWTPGRGARVVGGAIRGKWSTLGPGGWERSLLGFPVTDELSTPDSVGRFNHFEHGSIYWTPSAGAHEVHGMNRQVWASLGWERGWLGYPLTDETQLPDGSRVNNFQGGSIRWTERTGSLASHTQMPVPAPTPTPTPAPIPARIVTNARVRAR
jgi:hypothetical protein